MFSYSFCNVIACFYLFYFIRLSQQDDFPYAEDHLGGSSQFPKCEKITVKFCSNIEYNKTMMPNMLGHSKQDDAGQAVYQYSLAMKQKCHPDVQLFLCSLYLPVCTNPGPLLPCRSLCLSVRNSCERLLQSFNITLSPDLDCAKFPEDNTLCFGKNQNNVPAQQMNENNQQSVNYQNPNPNKILNGAKTFSFTCPDDLNVSKAYDDSFKIGNVIAKNCGLPCNDMFFSFKERQFSKMWIGTWSIVCALSCLFTVLTFMLNTSRFQYPERPIIFLAVCYLIVSIIYVLGFLLDDKVACRRPLPPPSDKPKLITVSTIAQGTKGELCTIMFIGLYFFSMASSLWWVILALTWFLAAGLKWGHEAIEANSQYFHLAAWAIPAIKTITILAMGKVEGKCLNGIILKFRTRLVYPLACLSTSAPAE